MHGVLAVVVATRWFDTTLGYPGDEPPTLGVQTWDEVVDVKRMEKALETASKAIGTAGDSWIPAGTVTIGQRLHIIACGDIFNHNKHQVFLDQQNYL